MSTQITRSMVILVTIVVAILSVFVGFTPAGRAQDPLNPNPNVNANAQNSDTQSKPSRKGRQRAEAKPKTDTTPNPSAAATTPTDQPVQRTATTAPTTQTDLSGTYVGVLDCADAGVTGDTTLTITGNQFTLADGKSGRITSATTRGYTAVAMQFGEVTPGQAPSTPPTIISMQARKHRDQLTLTTVPGAVHSCSFAPAKTAARARGPRRARPAEPPVATGAETANPAEAAATSAEAAAAGPTPPPDSSRARKGRRTPNKNANAKSNANANKSMNSNENTGTGNSNANSNASPTPTPRKR